MIKVLVSSKALHIGLLKLGGKEPWRIRAIDNKLLLDSGSEIVEVSCDFDAATAWFMQYTTRWDSVLKQLLNTSEQPIVLHVSNERFNIEFQF